MARVPEWCVLVALVGTGQAIHSGEEVGLRLWKDALLNVQRLNGAARFIIHAPAAVESVLAHPELETRWEHTLNLDTELRHHLVPRVHDYVEHMLDDDGTGNPNELAEVLWNQGHRFLLTRNLRAAKEYVQERYHDAPLARYGIIASSRCKRLPAYGVDNSFQTTKRLRVGPWFNSAASDPASCRSLNTVATEFQTQGLELDMAIVAWGSDFRRNAGRFSDALATRYKKPVKDSLALRRNAYRVLLTRGRDGTVIYVPDIEELSETYEWLLGLGCRGLAPAPGDKSSISL